MANSKEVGLFVIDTVGPVATTADKIFITGWNIYASNATWSITLKTDAGLVVFQSDNNSPTAIISKPIPCEAGIVCTAISNCTMRLYYEPRGH